MDVLQYLKQYGYCLRYCRLQKAGRVLLKLLCRIASPYVVMVLIVKPPKNGQNFII